MLEGKNITAFKEFLTYNRDCIPLNKPKEVKLILNVIHYYDFMYRNGDKSIAKDLMKWDYKDFKAWKRNGQPKSNNTRTPQQKMQHKRYILKRMNQTASTVSTTTITTTAPEIVSNKTDNSTIAVPTTTKTVVSTEMVLNKEDISNNLTNKNSNLNINNSKEEENEPKDVSSNLNDVATTATATADNIFMM